MSDAPSRKTVIMRFCRFDHLPLGLGRSFVVGEWEIVVCRTSEGRVEVTDHRRPFQTYPAWVDKAGWVILELPAAWPRFVC